MNCQSIRHCAVVRRLAQAATSRVKGSLAALRRAKHGRRGEWNDRRMPIETVLSMLTVSHFRKVMHRVWASFQARLAFAIAAFHVLVLWHGLPPDVQGFMPLSIAEFSL